MKFELRAAFTPKLFTTLKEGYTKERCFADLISGLIVGTVALPLAIAFGIASGVTPEFGVTRLLIATVLSGFIVLGMGLAKLGGVIKFIPAPVITGFTSGIAIIILSSQIKDFLGLNMATVPADLLEKWAAYGEYISSINWYAIGLAIFALAVIIYSPKLTTKIPGPFIALILCTLLTRLFEISIEFLKKVTQNPKTPRIFFFVK
jgi:SulP family sulfate permease